MSYQLKKLGIFSFVGIEQADIDFNKPVSLFVGLNNQGKSSVKDALRFAFTGKARGLTKFKDMTNLANKGSKKTMGIELDYLIDGEPAQIQRDIKTVSAGVDGHSPLIPFCLDPASFINLPARERGAILSQALGGGLDDIVDKALNEHVRPINETILIALRASGIEMTDIGALKDMIVELRRKYKQKQAKQNKEPKLIDYELQPHFNWDNGENQLAELDKRIAKGSGIIKANAERLYIEAQIADTKKEIERLQKQIKPVPQIKGIGPNELNDLNDTISLVSRIVAKGKGCLCPLCTCGQLTLNQWTELLEDRKRRFGRYTTAIMEKQEIEQANSTAELMIKNHQGTLKRLQGRIDGYKDKDFPKNAEKLLKELNEQRANLAGQLDRFKCYKADKIIFDETEAKKGQWQTLVDECNRIDDALKDGGPVKSAIAAGGRELPINGELLEVWGMNDLAWKDNGDILLNGRPIEIASKSEQYRAAAVMGLALAEVGDIGFAALDEFELLDSDNANNFFDAVGDSVNNVLVFASTDKAFENVPNWMEVFKVDGGAIYKL